MQGGNSFNIVSRDEWINISPKKYVNLDKPVKYVIVHDTNTRACETKKACAPILRNMHALHIYNSHLKDIAYNFLIASNGDIYEGRGLKVQGEHTPELNSQSYGIAFIGTYKNKDITEAQTNAWNMLMAALVEHGYLVNNYKVLGQRQVQHSKTPGDALYATIRKWPHWVIKP